MRIIHNILLIAAASALVLSCSLEEKPTSFVSRDEFYQNETQCTAALDGCYTPMASIFTANFMLVVESVTDIWCSASSTVDAVLDVTPAKPQFGSTVWAQGYIGVMRANECVDCITNCGLADDVKLPLAAEARTLRAFYYHILTCMFNGVPFYDYMVKDDATLAQIRALPRTDAREIRDWLIDDLKTNAIPYFNEEQRQRTSEITGQRMGYAVCQMLIAKMAMWNEEWETAIEALKGIEEVYGEFSEERYPLEETMWRYKNTAESIYEIQHDWSETGVKYAGSVANIMQPTSTVTDGLRYYDGVYLADMQGEVSSWNGLKANNTYAMYRVSSNYSTNETGESANCIFAPMPLKADTESGDYNTAGNRYYAVIDTAVTHKLMRGESATMRGSKVDRRVIYTIGIGDLDGGDTFEQTKLYGIGWAGPKFWCPGIKHSNDSNNYKILRYADALLMMAECYINLENSDEAMRYMNMTRRRAGADEYDNFLGFEDLTIKLRAERARELGGEFHRKFDLVRWGNWYEAVLANSKQPNGLLDRIRPYHRYYPIPATECALSGNVLTNDEYEEGGM